MAPGPRDARSPAAEETRPALDSGDPAGSAGPAEAVDSPDAVAATAATAATAGARGARAPARPAPADAPDLGDRYQLLEELGRGAMGVVWRARDRSLDREVAIKVLADRYAPGEPQERLLDEARAMARLTHPNVIAVHDVGVRHGRIFLAMELVRGVPLSTWLATSRPWPEVVALFRQLGAGLVAAHDAGLVHRDIKPGNIMVGDDGRPRLADFGVAHARHEVAPAVTATTTAGPIGTPAYMPPERLIGEAGAARGDQFSFCATLYEALHGRRPFPGKTTAAIASAIALGVPPPLRPVPAWLHAIVARGLHRDPEARFPSMAALVRALDEGPRRGRRGRLVGAVAALAVALAIVLWWVTRPERAAPGAPATSPVARHDAGAVATAVLAPPPPPANVAPEAAALEVAAPEIGALEAGAPRVAARDAGVPGTAASGPAATATDAGVAPRATAGRRAGRGDPLAGLSLPEIQARYRELRADFVAAARGGELARARALARQAAAYGDRIGSDEPYAVEMVMSCRLGDEPGARAAFRKIPLRVGRLSQTHHDTIATCKRFGVNLQDLLPAR